MSWLHENVLPGKRCTHFNRTAQTIELKAMDSEAEVRIEIQKIPSPAIVLLPQEIGQWGFLKNKRVHEQNKKGWWSRCDFMMLGESKGKYYAIFLEFKKTVPDSNEEGKVQLKWSLPILHNLLSMFGVDTLSTIKEEDITVKYFQIGQRYNERFDKRVVRFDRKRMFSNEEYRGITINYSAAQPKVRVSLRQLLEESA